MLGNENKELYHKSVFFPRDLCLSFLQNPNARQRKSLSYSATPKSSWIHGDGTGQLWDLHFFSMQ
jgi:hypothetical protein